MSDGRLTRKLFHPPPSGDPDFWSPATLAYIGDAVYELIVRMQVAADGGSSGLLHGRAVRLVSAKAQAKALHELESTLTKDEYDWYRRGRNVRPHSRPKHAEAVDYRIATGFETLIGYLYLTGQTERLDELTAQVLKAGKDAKRSE